MSVWPALSLAVAALLAVSGWALRNRWLESGAIALAVLGGMTWWTVSPTWAWSHHGFGACVWLVMAAGEYRRWLRNGGGFRAWFAEFRADRPAQDGFLAGVLYLLFVFLLGWRRDPISAAVVLVVAAVLVRRGRVEAAAPVGARPFDWRAFGRRLALVLLGFALFTLIVLLAVWWVLWIDLQSLRLSR